MRIAYVNTYYQPNHAGGGHVHMEQFVTNAINLGHEIWSYPNHGYSGAHTIPTSRFQHVQTLRKMDVLYVRVESKFPPICMWTLPPRRMLYRFPLVVWEFNTTPDTELLRGRSEQDVQTIKSQFRHYGAGCDLAVCMTRGLADYVQNNLGIKRTLVVPNASDSELFIPNLPIVNRLKPFDGKFNVIWIGSIKESWHDLQMIGEAASILCESDMKNDIVFHIIGSGLMGIMADMPSNVFYWGAEYYKKLPFWLSGMSVGLSLYRSGPANYATPLKVFDYMASGLAVISTRQPFMVELFTQLGQLDLLVSDGDSSQLASMLIRLSKNRSWVRHQGNLGRQLIIDKYNWKQSVQDTMNELETLLQERKKR